MYAWHAGHRLIGTETEAGLLVELWTNWMVLLQSCSDSLDGGVVCRLPEAGSRRLDSGGKPRSPPNLGGNPSGLARMPHGVREPEGPDRPRA